MYSLINANGTMKKLNTCFSLLSKNAFFENSTILACKTLKKLLYKLFLSYVISLLPLS